MCRNILLLFLMAIAGCLAPQRPPEELGTILATLPDIPEAKAPYAFPYGDHSNCKFSDDPFGE